MNMHDLGGGKLCLLLTPEECPTPESMSQGLAKNLARQALEDPDTPVELECYWSPQGTLLFVRSCPVGVDFEGVFRREILTGCGILMIDAE